MRYPKRENKRALVLEDINHTNRYQLPLSRLPEHKSSSTNTPTSLPFGDLFSTMAPYPARSASLIGCLRSRDIVDHRQKRPDG
ncbi:hypothetical protein TNCT_728851 [Trichonephila clavata]|uniref:Uncharacterized protein n=1 Tax=Trichonephila clavata TaxID=2740835 RepID=A0A8X6IM59_TRICU|nr:hypothetical protein TNCT_728851 [Trichonephila clavata]